MQNAGVRPSRHDLAKNGLRNVQTAYWNLGTAQLIEQAIQRHEGMIASGGAFVVRTGPFTGRSPKDKYIVRDSGTENTVDWGAVNQPLSPKQFDGLFERMATYWQGQDVFVQDCFAGADRSHHAADPRDHPARLAQSVRAPVVRPARPPENGRARAGIHRVFRARRFTPTRTATARARTPPS